MNNIFKCNWQHRQHAFNLTFIVILKKNEGLETNQLNKMQSKQI